MKIKDVFLTPGVTGFFFDDQKAIKMGAVMEGNAYRGQCQTKGFTGVRQRGEAISVILALEDGQIAFGDCAAVQYSGACGRDPLFLAKEFIPIIEEGVIPFLLNKELDSFRQLAEGLEEIRYNGNRLHTAISYGVTQAILDGVAKASQITMAEVIAKEYGTSLAEDMIPIFSQTGDERYSNADKAILKRADILPHGLINNLENKLGRKGEKLLEYVQWLKNRVQELGDQCYNPIFHIDVYGTIGLAFEDDINKIAAYLHSLEEAAAPFKLRIEGPIDKGSKEAQIEALANLRKVLDEMCIKVEIVADEWCNTLGDIKEFVNARAGHMVQIKTPDLGGINNSIEAVIYSKQYGIGAYLGGTCNETDRSAQVCVHIALATQPDQILAKPGMGVDEGFMIVTNEMIRTLALLQLKNK